MIDIVQNRLVFPLLSICKLHHAYILLGVTKAVEEFLLHFVPTINTPKWKVSVLIKDIPLKGSNKLFNQEVTLCTYIVISFDEMDNVLLQISFFIEWKEIWRLIAHRHI